MNREFVIKRVRGPFLYTEHERFLDLDRAGGRALFGWNEGRVMRRYRSVLAVGLSGFFPSYWDRRLVKHVKMWYPNCSFLVVREPTARLVRPWLDQDAQLPFNLVLPDLCLGGYLYLYQNLEVPELEIKEVPLSPAGKAALCAAFGAWQHHQAQEHDYWKEWEVPLWKRVGPWLFYEGTEEDYEHHRQELVQQRILLPVQNKQPACLPFDPLPAERKRWQRFWRSNRTRC